MIRDERLARIEMRTRAGIPNAISFPSVTKFPFILSERCIFYLFHVSPSEEIPSGFEVETAIFIVTLTQAPFQQTSAFKRLLLLFRFIRGF